MMKKRNRTPTPHDATFRHFLTQPEIARDFMELHLPAALRAICDLGTLKLESGSFVDYLSSPQLMALIHYLIQAGESADSEAFVRELALRVPQHGDALMTIAQQLEQKGIEKGRAEGIQLGEQRGIEKGRNEGKREVARTMLQNGLDRNTIMKMTGLTADELAHIPH